MTQLDVLNVGDGACSLLQCEARRQLGCRPTIIDCGQWGGNQATPAEIVADALGTRLGNLETMVVTHFDLDHWGGLRSLSDRYGRLANAEQEVNIVYPRLPGPISALPPTTLAFLVTVAGTGVRATELITAWKRVAEVHTLPVWAGDTFAMACRDWEVIWPPARLPSHVESSIARALDDACELADDLARVGFPQLRENLAVAYDGDGFHQKLDQAVSPEDFEDLPRELDLDTVDAPHPEDENIRTESFDILDEPFPPLRPAKHTLENLRLDDVPEALARRFRQIAPRLARANNLLSLAFHNPGDRRYRGLLVVGDLQRRALRAALPAMRPRYSVILAPHHGTVEVPDGFPSATMCISQAGDVHYPRWWRHRTSHHHSQCLSTHEEGHLHRRIP